MHFPSEVHKKTTIEYKNELAINKKKQKKKQKKTDNCLVVPRPAYVVLVYVYSLALGIPL